MSEIWTLEKKQLLIDSIINDFDIPKLYFHEFGEYRELKDGKKVKYAIIDGKQRLEAIWSFIDGEYPLADDIKYYADEKINLHSLTYKEIADKYPAIKGLFDSSLLPIITIETEDIDMIEEMFSRLNEAVPLNAAEKRNALGGPMVSAIRRISQHKFFKEKSSFPKKRYQAMELGCKFLWLTLSDKIIDTKKVYLDSFVKEFKKKDYVSKSKDLEKQVSSILNHMEQIFIKKDPLLRTVSMPVIYYLAIKDSIDNNWFTKVTRKKMLGFDSARKINRLIAEKNISRANYEFLEFDRMAQQGTNDGVSIDFRKKVLVKFLKDEM